MQASVAPTVRAAPAVDWTSIFAFLLIVVVAALGYFYESDIASAYAAILSPLLAAYAFAIIGVFGVTLLRGGERTRSVLEKLFGVFGPVPFAIECAGLWVMFYSGTRLLTIGISGGTATFGSLTGTLIESGSGLIWMAASVALLWDRGRSSFIRGRRQVVAAAPPPQI
jgi:hypothetical protein